MFFDSLIRRKQSVFTSTAPNFESISHPKQVYTPTFEPKREFYGQKMDSRMLITRSKSERQLNHNMFQGHLPHPILHKEKGMHPVGESQLRDQGQYISRERQQMRQKQKPVICNKHKKSVQSVKGIQKFQGSNQYDFRNYTKTPNSQKLQQYNEGNASIASEFSCQFSQLKQNTNSIQNFDRQSGYGYRSFDKNKISPLGLEKSRRQFLDNQVTKVIDTEYQNSLRSTVKSLEKQILLISQQRDKDKNKLLEYSLNVDKLKTQNQYLKKNSSSKSKQNIDVRGRDRSQVSQLKKVIRQQMQARQTLLKEKQTALFQLNQALNTQQNEKLKWQKQKKAMQNKIDALSNDNKQKVKENLIMMENINNLCEKNKNLRQEVQSMEKQLQEKQSETKWMSSKVNELKEALEYIKLHGNSRIVKLEEELMAVQSKRKQSTQSQIKNYQAKLREKQELIQKLRNEKRIQQNQNKELKQMQFNLKQSISQLQEKNGKLSKENYENKKAVQNLRELHQQNLQEKNKTIQALNKNIFSLSEQKENVIKQNKDLQRQILEIRSQRNTCKQKLTILQFQITQQRLRAEGYAKQIQKIQSSLSEANQTKQNLNQKIKSLEGQNKSFTIQMQRLRRQAPSFSAQKSSHQTQIYKLRKDHHELCQQKEEFINKIGQQQNIINDKNKLLQHKQNQIISIQKEMCFAKQQNQNLNKKIQSLEILTQEKDKIIQKLNQQILNTNTKIKTQQGELSKLRQVTSLKKIEDQTGKIIYSQLQMRLCSVLGIYLTNSVDKIINPIQQLIKLKRIYEPRNKFYQEILKVFSVKDSESNRLMMEIKQVKNGHQRMIGLEQETGRYKQQNNYLMDRVEWAACVTKKMQGALEDQNQIIIKLRLNLMNQRYNSVGTKKY